MFADSDLFSVRQGANGESEVPRIEPKLKKLFVMFNGAIDSNANRIQVHAPALRTQQQLEAFQEILRRIETASGIGKGVLSNLQDVQQTATQYSGSKKALYNKIDAIESELEEKYTHCAYVFAYMLAAFCGVPFDDTVQITYNDLARKDPTQQKQQDLQDVAAGIMQVYEYRMKWYGEDEETARAHVPVRETGGFVV